MPDRTPIQWTDSTWNPVRGCSRVSEGCRHCYAEVIASRFSRPGQAFHGYASLDRLGRIGKWTGKVELVPQALSLPLRWRTPRRIFVNSMSDLFHENLSDEARDQVFAVMSLATHHTFQVLTKRPAVMLKYFERIARISRELDPQGPFDLLPHGDSNGFHWTQCTDARVTKALEAVEDTEPLPLPLPNVWLGVSVEDQRAADERIPLLQQTPAAVRFISAEPLLGPVNLKYQWLNETVNVQTDSTIPALDWVIIGGESGHGARPFDVQWARDIVAQCRDAGVAPFVKQLGAVPMESEADWRGRVATRQLNARNRDKVPDGFVPLLFRDGHGGDADEWPEDLRVREFPAPAVPA